MVRRDPDKTVCGRAAKVPDLTAPMLAIPIVLTAIAAGPAVPGEAPGKECVPSEAADILSPESYWRWFLTLRKPIIPVEAMKAAGQDASGPMPLAGTEVPPPYNKVDHQKSLLRRVIENNVFKQLNELVGSRRGFLRNARVKEAMLLLWFAALVMLRIYLAGPGLAMVRKAYAAVKVMWKFVRACFCVLLGDCASPESLIWRFRAPCTLYSADNRDLN